MPILVYVIAIPIVLSLLFGLYLYAVNRSPLVATTSLSIVIGLAACLVIIDAIDFVAYLRSDSPIPLRDRLWDSQTSVFMVMNAMLALIAITQRRQATKVATEETGDPREHGTLGTDRA